MNGLIEYLSDRYHRVVEVGIGGYARVAIALRERGLRVTAVDILPQSLAIPVTFDDVRSPRLKRYWGVQAVYAIRPPPELVSALKRLACQLSVDLIIKPLAAEPVDGQLLNRSGSFFYLFPSPLQ